MEEERQESIRRMAELEDVFRQAAENEEKQQELLTDAEKLLEQARNTAQHAAQQEQEAEEALEEHKAAVLRLINRESAVLNDQTRLKTMRSQMEKRKAELVAGQAELAQKAAQLEQESSDAADRLAEEYRHLSALQQALTDKRNAFTIQDGELLRLRSEYDEKNNALQSGRSRLRLLTEMTRDMEGYNQSVRRAVQHANQAGMRGVRGVLTQLIRVPREYETAIDMALGAAQQNIVTEDEETAKRLIEYLRENKLGRATFLPMSAIRGKTLAGNERKALNMKGCIGIASDLIDFDSPYRDIVESLLGRTVIAQDLNSGIAIMRACGHAFRLVTLQGDVMHSGGSMTGGSTQSRMVNLLGRERELKELTAAIAGQEAKLEQLKQDMQSAQNRKEQLRSESAQALEDVHQQEIAVAREQEHADNADEALSAHQERMDRTAEAIEQITESMADIDEQLEELAKTETADIDRAAMEARTPVLQQALAQARSASATAGDAVMERTLQLADLRHHL